CFRPPSSCVPFCSVCSRPPSAAAVTWSWRTSCVLLFVSHHRRELVHVNLTSSPTAAWVRRQPVQATPWGRAPVPGARSGSRLRCGPRGRARDPDHPDAVRAPRANAVAERLVGTLRRECLDHLIVLDERHLRAVLTAFAAFYNAARPHRPLGLETPQP